MTLANAVTPIGTMLTNASFGNYLPGSPYGWGTSGIFVLHTIPSFTAITLGSPCPPK